MSTFSKVRYCIFLIFLIPAIYSLTGCKTSDSFTRSEIGLIGTDSTAGLMRVLKVNNPADETVLRSVSIQFTKEDLKSDHYRILKKRMLETVLDSTNEGVGIAAPQVGILRKVVAVQRFDKPGEPFEFYPNIRITEMSPEKKYGWEGCLSIPNRRDTVLRSEWVVISYTDDMSMTSKTDTVSGFTAVIFQHETDHLEGILYTDRAISGRNKKKL
jgi:peptide deformylase